MRVELYGCVVGKFGYHFRFGIFAYSADCKDINITGDRLLVNFG